MADVREVIEALEREIRFLKEEANNAAALRQRLAQPEEKNRQEQARVDLELMAHLLRGSVERIRKSGISSEKT